jgi:hypothetical protein
MAHAPGEAAPPSNVCMMKAPLKVSEFSKSRRVATAPSGLRTTIFQRPWILTPVFRPLEGPGADSEFATVLAGTLADPGDGAELFADCTPAELEVDCAPATAVAANTSPRIAATDNPRRTTAANNPVSTCSLMLAPLPQEILAAHRPLTRDGRNIYEKLSSTVTRSTCVASTPIGAGGVDVGLVPLRYVPVMELPNGGDP